MRAGHLLTPVLDSQVGEHKGCRQICGPVQGKAFYPVLFGLMVPGLFAWEHMGFETDWHQRLVSWSSNPSRFWGAGYSFLAGILPRIKPDRAGTQEPGEPTMSSPFWWVMMAHTLTSLSAKPKKTSAGVLSPSPPMDQWQAAPSSAEGSWSGSQIAWDASFMTLDIHWNTQKRTNHDTNHLETGWCLTLRIFEDQNMILPWISLASWTCEYWKRSNPTPTLPQSHWTSECWVQCFSSQFLDPIIVAKWC